MIRSKVLPLKETMGLNFLVVHLWQIICSPSVLNFRAIPQKNYLKLKYPLLWGRFQFSQKQSLLRLRIMWASLSSKL